MTTHGNIIELRRTESEVHVADFAHIAWDRAPAVHLTHYYSGEEAPPHRHAEARLLWTWAGLHVRFQCPQSESLIINDNLQAKTKTVGLWDRDVCEIFVAPDAEIPEHYFEFEAAPTGEWLDLEIDWKPDGRLTNWEYASGMKAAGIIGDGEIMIAMHLPWAAFGREPQTGDEWRINLFRCVGRDTEQDVRGHLAWQPTYAAQPNFHVPGVFGWLRFSYKR